MRQSRRRAHHGVFAFTAALTYSLHLLAVSSDGLVVFPTSLGFLGGRSLSMRNTGQMDSTGYGRILAASTPKDADTWSGTASGRSKSGVRSRVKSVLEKARRRTKIDTASSWADNGQSASTIADAASIGAFEIFEDETFSSSSGTLEPTIEARKESDGPKRMDVANKMQEMMDVFPEPTEMEVIKTDLVATVDAVCTPVSKPVPFSLPTLTSQQQSDLKVGNRVQYQKDMGGKGSGYVVLDVDAPPDVVWDCLLDFHSYPELIPTVRDIKMFTNTHLESDYRSENPIDYEDGTLATLKHGVPSTTRAAFTLSKFRLNIAAIHRYRPHPKGDYMIFTLDPACTNLVLQSAKGIWHTQPDPYGDGSGKTRVWLLCEVKVAKILPIWITDYAAKRAMPRATTWLRPQVETAAKLWLKKKPDQS